LIVIPSLELSTFHTVVLTVTSTIFWLKNGQVFCALLNGDVT